jgi:hypothetical protein
VQQDLKQYLDQDDPECTEWQRMMKVNKYLADLKINEKIQSLVDPVISSQIALEHELLAKFQSKHD